MKKILMLGIIFLFVFTGNAYSLSLGYQGEVIFDMQNLYSWGRLYSYDETASTYTATNSNPFYSDSTGYTYDESQGGYASTGPNSEDSWGIAEVDFIKRKDNSQVLWDSDTASTEITVFFYGLQDDMLEQNNQGATDIYQTGGTLLMYEDPSKNFTVGSTGDRNAVDQYNTVTDGNLILSMTGNPGRTYSASNGDYNYTTYTNFDFTGLTGTGNNLWDVTGGTNQATFDTDTQPQNADFGVNFSAFSTTTGGFTVQNGPTAQASAVPEPSTLVLLGSGLLGVAFFSRKKLLQ